MQKTQFAKEIFGDLLLNEKQKKPLFCSMTKSPKRDICRQFYHFYDNTCFLYYCLVSASD